MYTLFFFISIFTDFNIYNVFCVLLVMLANKICHVFVEIYGSLPANYENLIHQTKKHLINNVRMEQRIICFLFYFVLFFCCCWSSYNLQQQQKKDINFLYTYYNDHRKTFERWKLFFFSS